MNWLDGVILILVLGSVATSFSKGLSREIVGLSSAVAALILGIWFYGTAGTFVAPYVNSRGVANFLGFVIVFLGVLLLGSLVGRLLSAVLKSAGLSFFDRLLGAAFGALRGLLLAIALVMAILAFTPGASAGSPPHAVVHSRFSPYVIDAARVCAALAPYELKNGFRKSYAQVKDTWRDALKKKNSGTARDVE